MSRDTYKCPECGYPHCWRDEVDVGVGVIHGPYGCPECGWSEDAQYDKSQGESMAQKENPDHEVDQWGGLHPNARKNAANPKFVSCTLIGGPFAGEKVIVRPDQTSIGMVMYDKRPVDHAPVVGPLELPPAIEVRYLREKGACVAFVEGWRR